MTADTPDPRPVSQPAERERIRWRHQDCDPSSCVATMEQGCEPTILLRLSGDDEGLRARLFNAVRSVFVNGMDSPGVRDELQMAFYSVRDGKPYGTPPATEEKP